MKLARRDKWLLGIVAAIVAGVALYTAYHSVRTLRAWAGTTEVLVWQRDLPAGEQIAPADLAVRRVAKSRIESLTNPVGAGQRDRVIGTRTARGVGRGRIACLSDVAGEASLPPNAPGLRAVTLPADTQPGQSVATNLPGPKSPAALVAAPLSGLGIESIDTPPAPATFPPNARRRSAFRRKIDGGWAFTMIYIASSEFQAVEAFYLKHLPGAGYRLLQRGAVGAGRQGVRMTFMKGREHCVVSLYPSDKDNKVKIAFNLTRLDDK